MDSPSQEEQLSIIKELQKTHRLEEGDANVISYKWYEIWSTSSDKIPPINNSEIVDKNGVKDGLLKNKDYKIITTKEWCLLEKWYGGGPEIKITIFKSPHNGKLIPNLRIYKYQVYLSHKVTTIHHDNFFTLRELKELAAKDFGVNQEKYMITFYEDGKVGDDIDASEFLFEVPHSRKFALKKISKKTKMVQSKSFSDIPFNANNGICGLYNLGNTCYFNAAIQCLAHTMPLVQFLSKGDWKEEINSQNVLGTQGKTIYAFADIVANIWTSQSPALNPQILKNVVAEKITAFSGMRQHDSQEALMYLLDLLHEDINQCKERSPINIKEGDGTNDEEVAEETLKQREIRNKSEVYNMFFGLLKSKLVCPECHKQSVIFDPFSTLSIPLSYRTKISPSIHFIPLNPDENKTILRITMTDDETLDTVAKSISPLVGREVKIVLAKSQEVGQILKFIKDPNEMENNFVYYAFEVDPTKFYAITYPCSNHPGMFGAYPEILSLPSLIELPSETSNAEELTPVLLEHFSNLWDDADSSSSPQKVTRSQNKIVEESVDFNPPSDSKIQTILEKHLFSKTMRFKPEACAPCVARRRVYAVINKKKMTIQEHFNWKKLVKQSNRAAETGQPSMTLESCFDLFETNAELSPDDRWMCPHCKKPVCASKKMDIWCAPKILIIHLKRFFSSKRGLSKCDARIDYPDVLDIAPYLAHETEKTKYQLYAVINHSGTMTSGHYISHAIVNGKWYEFNDSHTTECGADIVHSKSAYVLFYQLIE